jgi:UDP-glucose 4-epimerase
MSVVLITGVSRFLGGGLAAQLAADPQVERVIGIDAVPPRTSDLPRLGRTEFVRADIRNPLIAKVVTQARVTTVVHAALMASPRPVGGRVPMQEMNVIGTMQLLAACQKSDTVERVVVRSTTAVYGCSPADPAVFTEEMHPPDGSHGGYAKDAVEVEGYVRGFARRRPDIEVSVLRMANILGPTIDNSLTRYLRMPVVPTPLGYDPRLQLLHEDDAIETLRLATGSSRPGIVNVAGDGVVTLAQMLRQMGRLRVAVPPSAVGLVSALVRDSGVVDFTAEESRYLYYGRVVGTHRLHTEFGYVPRYDTAGTVAAYAAGLGSRVRPALAVLGVGSRVMRARSDRRRVAINGA